MAIQGSMPIVPVYFAGGLPEEPVAQKLEVPYRHAAQDYIFGSPITPDELSAWPYADRRRRVMDAINALAHSAMRHTSRTMLLRSGLLLRLRARPPLSRSGNPLKTPWMYSR
jgi:hypothetical protein